MSILYLGSDPVALADRLAENLDHHARHGDFFAPTTIVVPNRYLRKWLRLHLARKFSVAINLRFEVLEPALWELLRDVDPVANHAPPQEADDNVYRLMVLSVLLDSRDPALAPLRRYLQHDRGPLSRLSCRRAWNLADRIGLLLRDYEYARQDALIQPWLQNRFGLSNADAFHQMMERAQRALFQEIIDEPNGKRATLSRQSGQTFKTFPQYAMERMTGPLPPAKDRVVHFFGFTQVCELHARAIAWLGRCLDIRFYHLNVLSAWLAPVVQAASPAHPDELFDDSQYLNEEPPALSPYGQMTQSMRARLEADHAGLTRIWGKAGDEAIGLLTPLADSFTIEQVASPPKRIAESVLTRLHGMLLGKPEKLTRLAQDTSLQIVACPGVMREVETVYNSILVNLNNDPSLRQNDVAVLVTDMTKYRAAIQAVFERPPHHLQYNLVDYSAASASTFGQAVLGMLELALESFSRARVFAVLLNPCFLARLGIDRTQAMTWLGWAENLGIYQGWDAEEKAQQGYPRSPLYAWRLGLQRLRLGRYMEMTQEDESAQRFADVIPFADIESTDRDHLDAFCRAVEGLLPTLARLRTTPMSGERWARSLTRLIQEFLDVPADRPEEAQVRDSLLAAIDSLPKWDALHDQNAPRFVPLALVREYVNSQLEDLPGNRGEYLVGGVTISALQPMRPVPFEIVYILGLGESLFPGSNALSSFDLRAVQRLPGDIRPAEARQYDFLATILSARRKLYLLYNSRDLQKDQDLLPAVPLEQLQRVLQQQVLHDDFRIVTMPLHADDLRFVNRAKQPDYQDVLVQPHVMDRCLSVLAARRDNPLVLDASQESEWDREWPKLQKDFAITPPADDAQAKPPANVAIAELRRFLYLPAQASLRRHLQIDEDAEPVLEEDEPLVTSQRVANNLARQTLQHLVRATAEGDINDALHAWPKRFAAAYDDARLCSRVPEQAFGEIDQAALRKDLSERIHGDGGIEGFLRDHAGMTFCGPVLLGESLTPLGARLRFPALRLRPGHEFADDAREVRISGSVPFAWHAPGRFEILSVTNIKEMDGRIVCEPMFEPLLLYFALLAGNEPNREGIISSSWLAGREFTLHVAYRGGIQTWNYPIDSITPAEALHYLVELTRDFLDPTQFDLIPFEALVRSRVLRLMLLEDAPPQMAPETFRSMLVDYLRDQRENVRSAVTIPPLVDMIRAQVPDDALAKVRRRFALLDRGPNQRRRMPAGRAIRKAPVKAT